MAIQSENEFIEHKKSAAELNDSMESISAILNKHGRGALYFGTLSDDFVLVKDDSFNDFVVHEVFLLSNMVYKNKLFLSNIIDKNGEMTEFGRIIAAMFLREGSKERKAPSRDGTARISGGSSVFYLVGVLL